MKNVSVTATALRASLVAYALSTAACAHADPATTQAAAASNATTDAIDGSPGVLGMQLRNLSTVPPSQDQARTATPRQWSATDVKPSATTIRTPTGQDLSAKERLIQVLSGRSVGTDASLASPPPTTREAQPTTTGTQQATQRLTEPPHPTTPEKSHPTKQPHSISDLF